MKRVRLVGIGLIALFMMSGIATATASAALPELVKAGTTKEVEKKGFKGTSGGKETTLEAASKKEVKCKSATGEGKITGLKTVGAVTVTFTGCKGSGVACENKGGPKETIKTKELEGELGYLNKATKVVGLDLKPVKADKELFVEFECTGFAKSKVKGSVIGENTTAVNTAVEKLTTLYEKGATAGTQAQTKFEGGAEDILMSELNGGKAEKSNQQGVSETTYEEKVELLA